MGKTLYKKVWDLHAVKKLTNGQTQLIIGTHILHEVTSPQAFASLRELGIKPAYPERTFATCDHIIPTDGIRRPLKDSLAEDMLAAIEKNTKEAGIRYFGVGEGYGVIHIVMPEMGLIRPGMTVACGDSHTATHGAFGAVAFGIGTSQVRDILATGTMGVTPLKVRKIELNGKIGKGVTAKDVILKVIGALGVDGGLGYAYEFSGEVIRNMSMEARMTVCNMAIEGGARIGYINPDETTFAYIKERPFAPKGSDWNRSVDFWKSIASDEDAEYDDTVTFDLSDLTPMVTWGITPAMTAGIRGRLPVASNDLEKEALEYMGLTPSAPLIGTKADVIFIGSCTNGRIEDLRLAASILKGRKINPELRAIVTPGSTEVKAQAETEGLDKIFKDAGFEWRDPGCSMCLAMNDDKLRGRELCISTSNRNFKGRQGSPTGRTVLASPLTAAASALEGALTDPTKYLKEEAV
ncbi:MAG: 3-isopropylmalate dehydratase large subunit [Deferribacteraceae bacterium]|jgi:3-isopropylmalate/(R)-2-methylmalate dehydratase large subunit|nr:3-isopropylmalate dehydratase large subunit [Deferribacteraceae bacterium]